MNNLANVVEDNEPSGNILYCIHQLALHPWGSLLADAQKLPLAINTPLSAIVSRVRAAADNVMFRLTHC